MSKTKYNCKDCGAEHGYVPWHCVGCGTRFVSDKPYEFKCDAPGFQLTLNSDVYTDPGLEVDDE